MQADDGNGGGMLVLKADGFVGSDLWITFWLLQHGTLSAAAYNLCNCYCCTVIILEIALVAL